MTSDKPIVWGAGAAVIALAAALYWYGYRNHHPEPAPVTSAPVVASQPEPALASAPVIEHPLPESSAPAPLPAAVDHSDEALLKSISTLPNGAAITQQLVPENIIRHLVAAVDNLPKKKLAANLRPFQPTPGQFLSSAAGGQLTISPDNYARYQRFVDMVKGVDADKAAGIYFQFYPLFQSAFDDLGYADGYFNDRVVQLIDHLLATPDLTAPPALVQPNVLYLYADPALEALSTGQKTLIRMGPDNEAVIKGKLRELKTVLLAHEHR